MFIISCISFSHTSRTADIYLSNNYGKTIIYRTHHTQQGFQLPFYQIRKIGYIHNGSTPPTWNLEIRGMGAFSSLQEYIYTALSKPHPMNYDLVIYVNRTNPKKPLSWNIGYQWESSDASIAKKN